MKLISSFLMMICLGLTSALIFQSTAQDAVQTSEATEKTKTDQENSVLADQNPGEATDQTADDSGIQDVVTGQTSQTLRVNYPVEMDYLLYLPEYYESEEAWPLVLFLHGAGERGDDLEQVKIHGPPKLIAAGKQFPFIVVSPQCAAGRYWEPVSLTALLDEIETKYRVDPKRIYVTGLSMGGFGTWSLAAHTPERFAAIVPICGGGDRFVVPRMIGDQMGIRVFHGAKDTVVPPDRSQEIVNGFKARGVDIELTVYPEAGHDSWTETYNNDELFEWLLSQSRD